MCIIGMPRLRPRAATDRARLRQPGVSCILAWARMKSVAVKYLGKIENARNSIAIGSTA